MKSFLGWDFLSKFTKHRLGSKWTPECGSRVKVIMKTQTNIFCAILCNFYCQIMGSFKGDISSEILSGLGFSFQIHKRLQHTEFCTYSSTSMLQLFVNMCL